MPPECRGAGRCRPSQVSSSCEDIVAKAFAKNGVTLAISVLSNINLHQVTGQRWLWKIGEQVFSEKVQSWS